MVNGPVEVKILEDPTVPGLSVTHISDKSTIETMEPVIQRAHKQEMHMETINP